MSGAGGRLGNFVVSTVHYYREGEGRPYHHRTFVREKHHRWKLERSQIRRYALGSTLDPTRNWWENLRIFSRSIDVLTLRDRTTYTTMICEDLARVDPCQELLRAVGPNLVIALLLDGPQLKFRWPTRYALVLADDPGSAVLTLTSFGLIERSNRHAKEPPSRVVALWQEAEGEAHEIQLPPDHHAIVISLRSAERQARTLDGRLNQHAFKGWTLAGSAPIRSREHTRLFAPDEEDG